jgi:hypothetical protein
MIDPKIPDEVVEAACLSRHGKNWHLFTQHCKVIERDMARAAITAGINAWPGMQTTVMYATEAPTFKLKGIRAITIPLSAPEETKP